MVALTPIIYGSAKKKTNSGPGRKSARPGRMLLEFRGLPVFAAGQSCLCGRGELTLAAYGTNKVPLFDWREKKKTLRRPIHFDRHEQLGVYHKHILVFSYNTPKLHRADLIKPGPMVLSRNLKGSSGRALRTNKEK